MAAREMAVAADPLLFGRPNPGRSGSATELEPANAATAVGGGEGGAGPPSHRPWCRLARRAVGGLAFRLCGPGGARAEAAWFHRGGRGVPRGRESGTGGRRLGPCRRLDRRSAESHVHVP